MIVKKLILFTALLFIVICGSANAWEYVTTYNDYFTTSFTVDSSDSGHRNDTTTLLISRWNTQIYNIRGGFVSIRGRIKRDTVFS